MEHQRWRISIWATAVRNHADNEDAAFEQWPNLSNQLVRVVGGASIFLFFFFCLIFEILEIILFLPNFIRAGFAQRKC